MLTRYLLMLKNFLYYIEILTKYTKTKCSGFITATVLKNLMWDMVKKTEVE